MLELNLINLPNCVLVRNEFFPLPLESAHFVLIIFNLQISKVMRTRKLSVLYLVLLQREIYLLIELHCVLIIIHKDAVERSLSHSVTNFPLVISFGCSCQFVFVLDQTTTLKVRQLCHIV